MSDPLFPNIRFRVFPDFNSFRIFLKMTLFARTRSSVFALAGDETCELSSSRHGSSKDPEQSRRRRSDAERPGGPACVKTHQTHAKLLRNTLRHEKKKKSRSLQLLALLWMNKLFSEKASWTGETTWRALLASCARCLVFGASLRAAHKPDKTGANSSGWTLGFFLATFYQQIKTACSSDKWRYV